MASQSEEWTKRLKPEFDYNMKYSNMDNETALQIVDTVVFNVIRDVKEAQEFTPVEDMLERAYEKFVKIKDARAQ